MPALLKILECILRGRALPVYPRYARMPLSIGPLVRRSYRELSLQRAEYADITFDFPLNTTLVHVDSNSDPDAQIFPPDIYQFDHK